MGAASSTPSPSSKLPLLVTVLGKGGAGKTTAAVLLAKFYASQGKRTCLLLQSLDRHAEELLGCHVSSTAMTPIPEGDQATNLCATRLETTKFLLEPLEVLKEADQRLGLSQGALAEVVGEELSVLPGMDSFAAIAALELLAKPGGGILAGLERRRGRAKPGAGTGVLSPFPWGPVGADVVVYDGPSSEDVLRMLGSPERGRWYLRRFRSVAESTDAGRVALPSIARALESELGLPSSKTSAEVWTKLDELITTAVKSMSDPSRVKVFLAADSLDPSSTAAARRLWGCAAQAGACVSGLLFHTSRGAGGAPQGDQGSAAHLEEAFPGLPRIALPTVGLGPAVRGLEVGPEEREVLVGVPSVPPKKPVTFDLAASTVSVFLPGLQKTDIKLQQWKGGAQLLVEAGDQRRCIDLPKRMQGKISGAKFVDGCLVIRTN